MSNTDKIRERIANIISMAIIDKHPNQYEYADQFLTDPDILIKSESQELPQCPTQEIVCGKLIDYDRKKTKPYLEAQQDILKVGWVKCEPKGGK